MQNYVVFRIDAEVRAIFVFFDSEHRLPVLELVDLEEREELIAHLYEFFLGGVVGGEFGDQRNRGDQLIRLLISIHIFYLFFAYSFYFLSVVAIENQELIARVEL